MTERTVAEWTDAPFTGYDRRGIRVQHRVVVARIEGVGVDVRHEIRAQSADGLPSEWSEAEVYESRPHGIERVERRPVP